MATAILCLREQSVRTVQPPPESWGSSTRLNTPTNTNKTGSEAEGARSAAAWTDWKRSRYCREESFMLLGTGQINFHCCKMHLSYSSFGNLFQFCSVCPDSAVDAHWARRRAAQTTSCVKARKAPRALSVPTGAEISWSFCWLPGNWMRNTYNFPFSLSLFWC